jgi:energy-converting hydrogenase B subunit D
VTALQISALVVVGLTGTAIALTPSPMRQTLLLAIFGFALTALFFAFQAPDVALSELVVSGVAMPLIILAALRRLADQHPGRATKDSPNPQTEGADEEDK